MIQPPRRSVTRFFIPLIDVLILLFCIFLLMPYVKPVEGEAGEGTTGRPAPDPPPEATPGEVADLRRRVDQLQAERDRLIRQREQVLERLAVRVLDLDPTTGRLYDYDPERVEIATQADAQALIDRERRRVGDRELFILILYPREASGYPLQRQVETYERWFRDVPHGFDNPSGRP